MCQANQKYWLVVQAALDYPPLWMWATNGNNQNFLSSAVHGFPLIDVPYWTVIEDSDMAFYLIGGPYPPQQPPKPDLGCTGQLSWDKIKPGSTVTGSFQVMNNGESDSHLNWTVESYPDWGTWSFTPSSGINLAPTDGIVIVQVEVTAPSIKNQEFQGQVKIVNTDNSSDFCFIPVTLTTPLNSALLQHPFIQTLFERFPHAFPKLRQLLG
jgi:hypothetical protein